MIDIGEQWCKVHVKPLGVVLCADCTETFTNPSAFVGHLKKYIHLIPLTLHTESTDNFY